MIIAWYESQETHHIILPTLPPPTPPHPTPVAHWPLGCLNDISYTYIWSPPYHPQPLPTPPLLLIGPLDVWMIFYIHIYHISFIHLAIGGWVISRAIYGWCDSLVWDGILDTDGYHHFLSTYWNRPKLLSYIRSKRILNKNLAKSLLYITHFRSFWNFVQQYLSHALHVRIFLCPNICIRGPYY